MDHSGEVFIKGALRSRSRPSEGALQQTMAAAAGWADFLCAEPLQHVRCMSSVTAAEAEVGGAPDRNVADGALEGESLADGALRSPHLATAVAAIDSEF